jgi:hypothetical protein
MAANCRLISRPDLQSELNLLLPVQSAVPFQEETMKRIILAILIASFAVGSAMAQSCATKAVSKDGKPLAGAAKTSFIKKCCEDSAVSIDGKPLSGAAKSSFVTKCEKGG